MTAVTAASMIATGVTFAVLMTVMTALHIGIEAECAVQKFMHSSIRTAADTAEQLDASLCKCRLCTASDAAADQHLHAVCGKEAGECTVTAAICRNDLFTCDLPVRNIIQLEFRCVSKVLKDLSIFVSD